MGKIELLRYILGGGWCVFLLFVAERAPKCWKEEIRFFAAIFTLAYTIALFIRIITVSPYDIAL